MTPLHRHSPQRRLLSAFLALTALGFAACGGDDDEAGSESPTTTSETSTETTAPAGEAPNTVIMRLVAYRPGELEVTPGTTVTWRHDDTTTHTVTSGAVTTTGGSAVGQPDGRFDSGNMTKGAAFEFTFDQAGDFPFYCLVHPATMTGVVHVK